MVENKQTIAIAAFTEKFRGIQPPTRQVIHNLNTRFEETDSVADLPRSGRPRSSRSEENLQIVAQAFVHSPNKAIRRASRELEKFHEEANALCYIPYDSSHTDLTCYML
jgi:hypothetical protein